MSNLESSKAPSGYGLGTNCTQITDWNTAISNGWYKTTTYDPGNNAPDGLAWYGLTINYSDAILVQLAFHADNVNICRAAFRWLYAGTWSNWESFATATPPQEFNLPLVDGISGTAKYSKDQFGIVRVYVAVLKNSGTITNNEILGTLPEGFRSKYNFAVVGFGNSNQNNIADRHPINMIISSNGNITASFLSETDGTKIASLYGTAEFLPES